jgi:protocatechuate 3,4-dioxygenase beta subunit
MRPVQILSIILVLALLVGAAGWFASTSDTDDATIADVEETTPAFTPDEPAAADLVAPADDFTPALGRAAIEDDVTPVAAEEGSAYIHGRVVDAVGKPLADAHIEVRAGGARGFPAGMHFPGMESLEAGSTRSATDGTFRVAVSQVGDLRLNVRKRGYTLLRRDVAVTEGSDTPLGDLALDRGVVLSGVVVDSAGRPIAGAQIHKPIERTQGDFMIFSPASQGPVAATTGHDGKFEVAHQAVGPWSLTISSEKHPSEKAEGETTQAGQHESGIHVVLDDGFSIQGRVTGIPAGEGGLLVRASEKASSPLGGIDFGGIELMGGGRREADVESDGSFAIEGLRRDTEYSLRVRVADAQVWTGGARSATVKALAGSTGVELEYSAGAALVFQVVDGRTGDPLTNFMVEAGIDWTMPHEDQEFEDGRVRYGNLRPRGDNSKARVKISAVGFGDYAQDGIAIRADEEVDLGVIRMISASVIRVTVLDEETNEPVEGARVTLTPETNPGQNVVFERSLAFGATELGEDMPMFGGEGESGKTDENGVAVVPNLPGETCTLRVTSKQHAPYRSAEFLAPSVGDGEREVQISRGGSVNVLALDTAGEPLEGVRVKHQAPGSGAMGQMMGGPSGSKTDDEGRVAFDRLEAGEHMFKLEEDNPKTQGGGMLFLSSPGGPDADMSDWTAVVVAGGQMADITLHAAPRSSVHGIVTEAGSLLSGAKVSLLKPEKEGDMMGGMMGFPSFGGGTSATTDSQGRYSFDDIRADEYRIEVTHPTREMPTFVPVEFGQGENKENINLRVAIVEGRVTDEAGEAVSGARVSAQRVTGSAGGQRMVFALAMDDGDGETIISNGPGGKATKTDEDGRYLLRGVASEVEIEVSANSGSFQPASETLTLGADEVRGNVDLLMRKAGEIKVTVLLADGSQAREVLIEGRFAGELEDGESVDPEVEFSMSGSGKLRKLRAGKWTVLARAVGPVEEGTGSEPVVVDVVPGETADVTVQLP